MRKSGRGKETLSVLYIVDESGKLLEDLRLGSLVLADPDIKVADIEDRPLVSIPATTPGEEAVAAFEKYDRVALPVVDGNGHMLGIITADDVLEFAQKQATEEIQKLGGTEALDKPYLTVGFWEMVRKRGVWLAVLFVSEMLTASVMQHFEGELEKALVLTLFIPLIMSSGGNSGSQATSLLIRALALHDVKLSDWWHVMLRELPTGLLLGAGLGIIGLFRVVMWQKLGIYDYGEHWFLVGVTVAAALVGVVTFGSVVGSMLPFLLQRVGFDPASASAPFVATLVDVTGLMIYFSVALLILRGTLL